MKGSSNKLNGSWVAIGLAIFSIAYHDQSVCQDSSLNIKDRDGNIYSIKIMADNRTWMTSNLNINIPGSYCYDNSETNCKQFGRLYTWAAAQEGCELLGEGWHLASRDEWLQLARAFGGMYGDSNDSGRTAFKGLLLNGGSDFNALLGGGREEYIDKYARINAHGFYWTSTETDNQYSWFINFGKGSGRVYCQNDGEKPRAFSVRCIK
ncbi:MAG: hypothetical protein C5B52_17520 [Bacteroidetes bacterium]|nr:MAG: hypothetical protein C5B52_17520 [Bacteroidota bacterium]